jgi:signal transduction histidine kinase/ligand-binding sensor domain-containing protein
MHLRHQHLLLLACILLVPLKISAQTAVREFDYLSIEEGLSQSSVHCIAQDRQGYMWFGTEDGLNRYDGYRFTAYRRDPGDSTSLGENYIASLFLDKRGVLWVGTKDGLNAWDEGSQSFHHALVGRECLIIREDASGLLWIGTDSGLVRFDPQRWTSESVSLGTPGENLLSARITALLIDSGGVFWIGRQATGTLTRLDVATGQSRTVSTPGNHDIWSISEEANGDLLLGTYDSGIYRYDRAANKVVPNSIVIPGKRGTKGVWSMCSEPDGGLWLGSVGSGLFHLSKDRSRMDRYPVRDDYVLSLFEDHSGLLWIGTGKGINKWVKKRKQFNIIPNQLQGRVRDFEVWSFSNAGGDSLWIGANNGLYLIDSRGNTVNGGPTLDCIGQAVLRDPSGCLWVGTLDKGILEWDPRSRRAKSFRTEPDNPRSIPADDVRALARDSAGALWLGTAGGLCRYDVQSQSFDRLAEDSACPPGLKNEQINCLTVDPQGAFWIGARNGLWYIDRHAGTSRRYTHDPGNPETLSDNRVQSMLAISPDLLWVGTYGGLDRLDVRHGTVTRFSHVQGLPNDVVYGILEDDQGYLWLSTNKGLSKFDPAKKSFRNYDISDGLQSDEFNHGAFYKDDKGRMFFGGVNGFNAFEPREITDNHIPPPVVFTDLRVFDKSMNLAKRISEVGVVELQYSQNYFSVEFAALDFSCPAKNRYAYMLEGFDKDWISCGTRRYAAYTNLDGGTYVFHVRGSNSDGTWNTAGASFTIRVIPPFWRTWWFYVATTIVVISGIAGFVSWRFVLLRRKALAQQEMSRQILESQENERKRIGASLHDSLGQNLLIIKNLAAMGLAAAQERRPADESLNEISTLASGALAEVREISYNLRPYQIDRLGLTGALRSIMSRVAASSQIAFAVDMDNVDSLLPKPLEINAFRIVQEAINNIVKHSQATEASVIVKRTENSVTFTVSDNGKGFDSDHQGFGLTSMAERARILGGSLIVRSHPGGGTRLEVTVPIGRQSS